MNRRDDTLAVEVDGQRRDVPYGARRRLQAHAERRGERVDAMVVDLLDRIARENLVDAVLDAGRTRR